MDLTRRFATLGLAAGAVLPASAAFAQPVQSIQADPHTTNPQREFPKTDEPPTEVGVGRDKFEHLVAQVELNGQGPFNFILDTGANTSCVSRELAAKLMLASGGLTSVHTMVGVRERPSVIIDSLKVGSRHRKEVHAPALPTFGGQVDGVLGVDWLGGQRLVLDMRQKKIEITRSEDDRSTGHRVVVPCRRRLGQLTIVDADMSGRRINAMIDSGSQVSLCNMPLYELASTLEAHSRLPWQHEQVKLETIAGEPFSGDLFYVPFLRLGGLQLGNVPVVYSAATEVFDIWGLRKAPTIVIGMDLLEQFDLVALDYGRNQVRFDISEPGSPPPPPARA